MKKLMAILLAVLMLCGAVAMAEDLTGVWALHSAQAYGMTISAADLGMEASFELRADGSCLMKMDGDDTIGKWHEADGKVYIDDNSDELCFTMKEGKLVSDEFDGVVMIFARADGAAAAPAAAPAAAAGMADFEGEWVFTYAETMGISLSAEEMGMDWTLTVKNGVVSMSIATDDGDNTAGEVDAKVVDGMLNIYDGDVAEFSFVKVDAETLCYTMTVDGLDVNMYMGLVK